MIDIVQLLYDSISMSELDRNNGGLAPIFSMRFNQICQLTTSLPLSLTFFVLQYKIQHTKEVYVNYLKVKP